MSIESPNSNKETREVPSASVREMTGRALDICNKIGARIAGIKGTDKPGDNNFLQETERTLFKARISALTQRAITVGDDRKVKLLDMIKDPRFDDYLTELNLILKLLSGGVGGESKIALSSLCVRVKDKLLKFAEELKSDGSLDDSDKKLLLRMANLVGTFEDEVSRNVPTDLVESVI